MATQILEGSNPRCYTGLDVRSESNDSLEHTLQVKLSRFRSKDTIGCSHPKLTTTDLESFLVRCIC